MLLGSGPSGAGSRVFEGCPVFDPDLVFAVVTRVACFYLALCTITSLDKFIEQAAVEEKDCGGADDYWSATFNQAKVGVYILPGLRQNCVSFIFVFAEQPLHLTG